MKHRYRIYKTNKQTYFEVQSQIVGVEEVSRHWAFVDYYDNYDKAVIAIKKAIEKQSIPEVVEFDVVFEP
jgi:hypothetical protein